MFSVYIYTPHYIIKEDIKTTKHGKAEKGLKLRKGGLIRLKNKNNAKAFFIAK